MDIGQLRISVGLIDAPPMIAAFLFGPVAGIVSGVIAALERALTPLWGVGVASWGRCCSATLCVALYAVVLRKTIFSNVRPSIVAATFAAAFGELLHLALITVIAIFLKENKTFAFEIVYAAVLPMTIGSGLTAGLCTFVCKGLHGWMDNFCEKTTRLFLIFSALFALIVCTSLYTAKKNTYALLVTASDKLNLQLENLIGFSLHRCAYNISIRPEFRNVSHAVPSVEEMEKIRNSHSLDEVTVVSKDGQILASSDETVLSTKSFSREDWRIKPFFDLLDEDKTVVQQGFRNSMIDGTDLYARYVGVA